MATAQVVMLPVCDGCESDDAKWVCEDCCIHLCDRCKNVHQRIPKTQNDTIIPIRQAEKGNKRTIVPVLCQLHKTKVCDLYCLSCEILICARCLSESHKTHQFDSVESFTDSKVSELDNIEQKYKSKLSLYKRVLESESKNHAQYLSHIDQLEVEVKGQSDKIVKEFYKLRDQQLSELTVLRKNEKKRYQTKSNSYLSETKNIEKHMESVHKAKLCGHVATMIEVVTTSAQSYQPEVPTLSNLPRPEFQRNDNLQPRLFLQLQGRIYVRDTEVERRRKISTAPASQRGTQVVSPEPAIDMQNVKVKSNIQIKGKEGLVRAIIPIDNNIVWVAVETDKHLTLIDWEGNVVKTSLELQSEIGYAVEYQGEILVTCYGGHCVVRVSEDGDTVCKFSDLSPCITAGLCVTNNQDVLVCLLSSLYFDNPNSLISRVVRLDSHGNAIQEIQNTNQGPLFTGANRVTSLPTGDVAVVDYSDQCQFRIVCVDNIGNMKYIWNGKVKDRTIKNMVLGPISHDGQHVYVTDITNNCVYVLDSDGKAEQFMLDKLKITCPYFISLDNNRQVWIGCKSEIYVLD